MPFDLKVTDTILASMNDCYLSFSKKSWSPLASPERSSPTSQELAYTAHREHKATADTPLALSFTSCSGSPCPPACLCSPLWGFRPMSAEKGMAALVWRSYCGCADITDKLLQMLTTFDQHGQCPWKEGKKSSEEKPFGLGVQGGRVLWS